MPAEEMLKPSGHSYPDAGADIPGDLNISVASLWVMQMLRISQQEEPLHPLMGKIPGFMVVFSPSHASIMMRDRY
jgi:hypothetical protein